MSDTINNACKVLHEAAATFRNVEAGKIVTTPMNSLAEKCEKALADLRLMASGDERFR